MQVAAPQAIASFTALPARPSGDVARAANSFEAMLLQSLLDSLEKTFCSISGSEKDHASETYHSLGTQALAGALAQTGAFGIARMITDNLLKTRT